mmetsp:Transcript_1954/g.3476  ORF Transcript_1954/g.3476 Transcript_1954/m.3476 type:complete len:166 (-) Transcript_1954:1509-2006(-)
MKSKYGKGGYGGNRGDEVVYDASAHYEYLSGFSKRKKLRKLEGKKQAEKQLRELKIDKKKQERELAQQQRQLYQSAMDHSDDSEHELTTQNVIDSKVYRDANGSHIITATTTELVGTSNLLHSNHKNKNTHHELTSNANQKLSKLSKRMKQLHRNKVRKLSKSKK